MVSSLVKHSSVGEIYESCLTFQLLRTVTEHPVIFSKQPKFSMITAKEAELLADCARIPCKSERPSEGSPGNSAGSVSCFTGKVRRT